MFQAVNGDILLSQAQAIAHGVAPFDHFNQGLALALRERWPAMAKDFRHWCHDHNPHPGEIWQWRGVGGPRIFNLLTQESAESAQRGHPGKAKLEWVNHALKLLRKAMEDESLTSLAIPRLASGVGGLDWTQVQELVQRHFGDAKFAVVIYQEYKAGVAAQEKLPTVA